MSSGLYARVYQLLGDQSQLIEPVCLGYSLVQLLSRHLQGILLPGPRRVYQDAVDDYNEIQAKLSGNTYKATKTGYISEMLIDVGDSVGSNTQICNVYNDQIMKLRLPFLSGEAGIISQGMTALITLSDTGEQLTGTVSSVSAREEVLTGGTLVRYVTIEVANPGGLTSSMTATAVINDCYCAQEGTFEASVDTVMSGDLDGTVKVEALLVTEGSYITEGTPIFQITADSAADILDTYENAVDNAQSSVESAQNQLESTQDSYDNYTITAPISGQIITKTSKVGDNIDRSGSSTTTMAVIYDLSELTFEMSIDELDIQNVKVGQTVQVTADAFEGQTFTGTVTNVSLQSTASNGVTNYPVTVTLDEVGDLLPGMNVDGVIILDSVENALSIPVDSLMRGNQVYVKDDTVTEAQGAVPAGFRAVEVETGLISSDYVEILSGLEEGQEVYVAESSTDSSAAFMMMPGGGGGMPGGGGPAAVAVAAADRNCVSYGCPEKRSPAPAGAGGIRKEVEVVRPMSETKADERQPLIELKDIYKIYKMGDEEVRASNGVSFTIYRGEFVAIVGKSGSGKSTLMNIIGALDVPTSGEYYLGGEDVSDMSDDELAEIRNKMIGFIFQQYNLLPKLNLLENVELPLLYAGVPAQERKERALASLERVGLKEKWKNMPSQLSGGQQQRVSIARALAGDPSLILADEPTGALDSKTSREVLNFLKKLNEEGNTIVMITHDNSIAMEAKRVIRVHDGKINFDGDVKDYAAIL